MSTNDDFDVTPGSAAKWIIFATLALLALTWVFQGNDFFLYKMFAPKQEAVRREVFKQSQAYNDGMANQLSDIQRQYATTSDTNAKLVLLSTAYHRFASYDASQLPPDLQQFLSRVTAYELHQTTRLP